MDIKTRAGQLHVKTKFKIVYIHPRSRFLRPFITKECYVHVMLENGSHTFVHCHAPKYYESKQYLELVAEELKKQLCKGLWSFLRLHKSILMTSDDYLTRLTTNEKSYAFCGLEGEVEVST